MNTKIAIFTLGLVLSGVVMAGCSKTETYGDRLAATGSTLASEGKRWNDGNEMSQKGDTLVKDGRTLIAEGQAKVSEGERLQAEGQNLRRLVEEKVTAGSVGNAAAVPR